MNVSISARSERFVQDIVRDGRFETATDAVDEALRLLQERETKQQALRGTLNASIARGGSHTDEEVGVWLQSRRERRRTQQAAE